MTPKPPSDAADWKRFMPWILIATTALVLVVVIAAVGLYFAFRAARPASEDEKTVYTLGVMLGQNISMFNLSKAELETVKKGFVDGASGTKPQVDLETYKPKVQALAQVRGQAKAEGERKKGDAFLEKAATEKGASKTSSGLVYTELTQGTGSSPKETDTVKVNYRGTLTDGKEFDSSYKRGQPAEFPLNGVIKCWTEALQKMKVGGKAKVVCPSSIAYGDQGHPPVIPGGATLIFEVELLGITPK